MSSVGSIRWNYWLTGLLIFQIPIVMTSNTTCRDSWYPEMQLEEFRHWTCGKCLLQVFFMQLPLNVTFKPPFILYHLYNHNISYIPDPRKSNLCRDLLRPEACEIWTKCCDSAVSCCLSTKKKRLDTGASCPATWDGVACWPETPAGVTRHGVCPEYYVDNQVSWTHPTAHRTCTKNATWFVHPTWGRETTDYTNCFNMKPYLDVMMASVYTDYVGNTLSIIALVIAIIMFVTTRFRIQDPSQRDSIVLHLNFFTSLLLMGASNIAWAYIAHEGLTNSQDPIFRRNPVWCRVLHWLMKYFRSTTYLCMFSEGLYLHRRLFRVMRVGSRECLPIYLIISWVFPLIILGLYAVLRVVLKRDETCWIDHGPLGNNLDFLYIVPNLLSLLCNLGFLITIQWTLCTQMNANDSDSRVPVLRRAMRVSLVLVPVFGLQFLFIIYRPGNWPPYEIISNLFTSTQGLFVVVLYCTTTKEVRHRFENCCHGKFSLYDRRGSTLSWTRSTNVRSSFDSTSHSRRGSKHSQGRHSALDLHVHNAAYNHAQKTNHPLLENGTDVPHTRISSETAPGLHGRDGERMRNNNNSSHVTNGRVHFLIDHSDEQRGLLSASDETYIHSSPAGETGNDKRAVH